MVGSTFQFPGGLTKEKGRRDNVNGRALSIPWRINSPSREAGHLHKKVLFQFPGGLTAQGAHGVRGLQRDLSIPWRINREHRRAAARSHNNHLSISWRINVEAQGTGRP